MKDFINGLKEEPIDSVEIYRGKVVNLFSDRVRLPNGRTAVREVVRHPGAVCVVPLTAEGEVLLVRQYRYPFGRTLLEIPAGKLEPGEDTAACAARELSEETGAVAGELTHLGDFYPSVAIFDEVIHMYLATALRYEKAHTDEDEFLNVERMPLETLAKRILAGEIQDGKTQAAVLKVWCGQRRG